LLRPWRNQQRSDKRDESGYGEREVVHAVVAGDEVESPGAQKRGRFEIKHILISNCTQYTFNRIPRERAKVIRKQGVIVEKRGIRSAAWIFDEMTLDLC
jgi:hypothetical protein